MDFNAWREKVMTELQTAQRNVERCLGALALINAMAAEQAQAADTAQTEPETE